MRTNQSELFYVLKRTHHPTAIRQVLHSVREIYPHKRVIVLFEPRSWSLRRNFFQGRLSGSFLEANEVFIREVEDFLKGLDYRGENVVVILSNGSFDGLPGFVRDLKR